MYIYDAKTWAVLLTDKKKKLKHLKHGAREEY